MANDLLIAACLDLTGEARCDEPLIDRMVASLGLGKAGAVRFAQKDGSFLAARREQPVAAGTREQPRPARFEPTMGDDGAYTLFAGRLEDREQLCVAIGASAMLDDAALYALANARHGNECDRRLNGDYAAVRWFPDKRTVWLSRSATSMRPLHVWRVGGRLVVSSIPRALFAAGMDSEIDQHALSDALLLNYRDGTSSWYRKASRVACGTWQMHDRHGIKSGAHWSPTAVPDVRFSNDQDYVDAVDEQFAKATRNAMEGIKRPAIALSGGLDSQAVASYLCEHVGGDAQVASYTSVPQSGWNPPDKPYSFGDESEHVRALAKMYPQIDPHFVSGGGRPFGADLDAMHLLGSWPMRNESNMHWIHETYSLASQAGSGAILFGAAGNSGFSYDGLTGYGDWLRTGRWGLLANELSKADDPRPFWRKLVSLAMMPNISASVRKSIDELRGNYASIFKTWCPMRREFAFSSGALDRAKAAGFDPDMYDGYSAREWRAGVLADTLSENAEIDLGMQLLHGIPSRDPTLYRPLLELCIGIGDEQYLRDGTDRWLARRLLKGRIPENVRTERRFGRQAADWAMRFQRDRAMMQAELQSLYTDEYLSKVFNAPRLSKNLADWSGEEDSAGDNKLKINSAIARAVSTARFIRYAQGRNAAG